MQDSALPREPWDAIIDDLETLRSCALVSLSFLPHSRARIFSHLRAHPTEDGLLRIFTGYSKGHRLLRHAWNLSTFATVSRLSADTAGWRCLQCPLPDLSVTQFSRIPSLLLILALPTLTCIELTGIVGLPVALLGHCPALRSVTLERLYFYERSDFDFMAALIADAASPPAQLEHVSLHLHYHDLEMLVHGILLPQSPPNVSCLRSLTCTHNSLSNHPTIQPLLNGSIASDAPTGAGSPFNLRELSTLHTLTFDVWPGGPIDQWWVDQTVFPPPGQALALVPNIYTYSARPEDVQLARHPDRILAALPCITSVTVKLYPHGDGRTPDGESCRTRSCSICRCWWKG
ncbi:hypothetical protein MVEN_01090900 [Mycena venus]|uniref:Uncharacterized protein n=1 Tax=Mycena venus TaxID=2733690 RepID=A0A8H7CXL0_9AGAR|nr:hypothetical protein MVEN_01090900 [Mycena venus]